jgi:hypothetical protein
VAASAAGSLPLPAGARECSLWLRKTAPPLVDWDVCVAKR